MTEAAPEVSREEHRALWLEVVRWPLKGGMLGGVVLFALLAWVSVRFEGGATSSQRDQLAYGQTFVLFAAIAALGVYAWRAISCTYPAERPVPWFLDSGDGNPLSRRIGTFVSVLFLAFLPAVIWLCVRLAVEPAPWVDWLVLFATSALGGMCLPLGLAGAVVRGSPLAALPGPVLRMHRAEPRAARIASTTGVVFVGCLVLSFWMSAAFVKHPTAVPVDFLSDRPRAEPETVGAALAAALFALRAAGFYAALVSFRVAGLLVREVPEIREAIS